MFQPPQVVEEIPGLTSIRPAGQNVGAVPRGVRPRRESLLHRDISVGVTAAVKVRDIRRLLEWREIKNRKREGIGGHRRLRGFLVGEGGAHTAGRQEEGVSECNGEPLRIDRYLLTFYTSTE